MYKYDLNIIYHQDSISKTIWWLFFAILISGVLIFLVLWSLELWNIIVICDKLGFDSGMLDFGFNPYCTNIDGYSVPLEWIK